MRLFSRALRAFPNRRPLSSSSMPWLLPSLHLSIRPPSRQRRPPPLIAETVYKRQRVGVPPLPAPSLASVTTIDSVADPLSVAGSASSSSSTTSTSSPLAPPPPPPQPLAVASATTPAASASGRVVVLVDGEFVPCPSCGKKSHNYARALTTCNFDNWKRHLTADEVPRRGGSDRAASQNDSDRAAWSSRELETTWVLKEWLRCVCLCCEGVLMGVTQCFQTWPGGCPGET